MINGHDRLAADREALRKRMMTRFGKYLPNHVPLGTRVLLVVFAGVLIAYATVGIYIDDLVVPGRRGRDNLHLNGWSAWFFAAAVVFYACAVLAQVLDHYDKRDNEDFYKRFESNALYLAGAAVAFSVVALLLG